MKKRLRPPSRKTVIGCVGAIAIVLLPSVAHAQTDVEELGRRYGATPPPEYYRMLGENPRAFQFSENGGWRVKARRVAETRNLYRSTGNQAALSAGPAAQAAVTGDLNVPVLLVMYANTDSTSLTAFADRSTMETRLFGTNAAPPYSIHSYYKELSNDALEINGTVVEWAMVPGNDSDYEGRDNAGDSQNGFCGNNCTGRLIRDLVSAVDGNVDFTVFDNDGPDGVPNSGDDDGIVDVLVIVHPEVDGACGTDNIWAHRWNYNSASVTPTFPTGAGPLPTADAAFGGGFIKVNDYIIQGGQGGATGCTAGQPQSMGVVAHELGHTFALPDLYDTGGATQGIGGWGLMGSGNWQVPTRPVHMSAWSKGQLGWITQILIDSDTTLSISPIESADTSYVVAIPNTSEYFELSNRQAIGADKSLIVESSQGTLNTGLLIWHVDPAILAGSGNAVNAGSIHGLALEEADGDNDLAGTNRGDAGDSYPGTSANTSFAFNTNPSSAGNDGTRSYITINQIVEEADSSISLNISYQIPTIITLTHSQNACSHCSQFFAEFYVDNEVYSSVFEGLLAAGVSVRVEIDAVQFGDGERRRFTWLAWSDGGARNHDVVASGSGDSLVGQMKAEFLLEASVSGQGSLTASGASSISLGADASASEFVEEELTVTLVAVADAGNVFERWTGTLAATFSDTLVLQSITRPILAEAQFRAELVIATSSLAEGTLGFAYRDTLEASGGRGTYFWTITDGALPPGLTIIPFNGLIQGTPTQRGSFTANFRASSGLQSEEISLTIVVGEPTLALANVVATVFGSFGDLTSEELNFLDLQGNRNGGFDLGDFLAWVDQNNITVSAAVMSRIAEIAGREGRGR